jgi:hypothetical protein
MEPSRMQHRPPSREQRHHFRHPYRFSVEYVRIREEAEDRWLPGEAIDCSLGGIRILAQQPLPLGEFVRVRLGADVHRDFFVVTARVIHLSESPDGGWYLGCQFLWVCGDPASWAEQDLANQQPSDRPAARFTPVPVSRKNSTESPSIP